MSPQTLQGLWNGPPLQGEEGQEVMRWVETLDAPDVYCKLLHKAAGDCADCSECAERMKRTVLNETQDEILQIVKRQEASKTSRKPLAVFVLGAVGSGKTGFIKKRLEQELGNGNGFLRSAVHINADDLRSALVGGYAIYSAMVNHKGFDRNMRWDANELRSAIQNMVWDYRVDVIADSMTLPAGVAESFLQKGFDVRVFHIEIAGSSHEEKVDRAKRDIEARVAAGGHSAPSYVAQIVRSRVGHEHA